jgi:DNA-binding transcriptional LysR family regulator
MARIYYKGIQLDQIRSFCRAARLQSFAAAAAELGISAPTVWRQVRALEREYGVPLLSRKGRAVQLTGQGRSALEMLEPHVRGIDSVPEVLRDGSAGAARRLTLASTSMLFTDYLAEPLRQYVSAGPEVLLSLLNEPADLAQRRVVAGEADIGVITYIPDEPRDPQLDYEDLIELPWLLATAAGDPLMKAPRIRPADLTGRPWILPARETQPRRRLEEILRRLGIRDKLRVVLESRTFSVTETYVAAGLGISVLYGADPKRPPRGIRLREVTRSFGTMPVAIIARKGRHSAPHIETFLRIVRKCLSRPPGTV